MFEKVNPAHPDKVADRIAGAIVDLAYKVQDDPIVAVEVLIGHGTCHAIIETSAPINKEDVAKVINRIGGNVLCDILIVPQDAHLASNQKDAIRCGDNGVFNGTPVTEEQRALVKIAKDLYSRYPFDGKYILNGTDLVICQSHATIDEIKQIHHCAQINPLGEWTGGTNVDTGATNRKLGSDMADSVTGGGLHGKDLSKSDVSVNIYAWLEAQRTGKPVEMYCAIGDETVCGTSYRDILETARAYINAVGGFEKFAEWGLVR